MLDQQTKKRIDDCRNILVGKITDPKSQVEQITIALIYKFMDDMDTEAVEMGGVPTYFVGEYERYSWKNIFSPRIGGDEMLSLYGEGMVKMNLNPSLPQLFRDIFKNAYLPYRDPETLKLFLKTINEFKYDHSERLGDAFEYLLSVLGSQGDAGQFRTPRHIIDFIVEIINPKKTESFMDPACGTSGFLISGFKHILKNNTNKINGDKLTPDERKKLTQNITGFDISPDMVRLSLVNLFLHGFTNPKVYEYDTLTSEDRWNEYYDVILANPPFMSPKGGIRPHKRFGVESNRAEVLFVDYIMEHLTPKGRAGIVVPEGIINQQGLSYKSLRKSLVEKYLVGVISLPRGVFLPYSAVKTFILILDKDISKKTDSIFFCKVNNDGRELGSQRLEIKENDLPTIQSSINLFYSSVINKTDFQENDSIKLISKDDILLTKEIDLNIDKYDKLKIYDNSIYPIEDINKHVNFKRGTSITKRDVTEGEIPVIAGGQTPAYFHNEYNRIGQTITISSSGAYSGFVNFFERPIFASDCFTVEPKNELILRKKFLFYLLKSRQNEIYKLQVGAGQPHVYPKSFVGFQIPIPPIDIQDSLIDSFDKINIENKELNKLIFQNNLKISHTINSIWGIENDN
jgi:type I restriction enzyme M protein